MSNNEKTDRGFKAPIKKLSKEITQNQIQKLIKEITTRSIKEKIQKLNEKELLNIEKKFNTLSEQEKIEQFHESIDKITQKVIDGGLDDTELAEQINSELDRKLSEFIPQPRSPLIERVANSSKTSFTMSNVAIIIIFIAAIAFIYLPFANSSPIAYIDPPVPDTPIFAGMTLSLSGHGADDDKDDSILAYQWLTNTNELISREDRLDISKLSPGKHELVLKVMDNHNAWSKPFAFKIEILANNPPLAYIDSVTPEISYYGTPITFSGHGNFTNENNSITKYEWSVNGTILSTEKKFTIQSFPPGKHVINFKLKDSYGAYSEQVSANFEILNNNTPRAFIDTIIPSTPIYMGIPITFSGHGEDTDKDEIIAFEWKINDINVSNAMNFTKKSLPIGPHKVIFRVQDIHGDWSEPDTKTIEVISNPQLKGVPRVWDKSWAVEPYIWDSYNFEGFFYDLKYDISTETMKLFSAPASLVSTRTIPKNGLVYNTGKCTVDFKVYEKEGVSIGADKTYNVVGWQAEKWVAIKGLSNKIAKLAFEMDKEEKKTMTPGETWALGAGYELTINAIDARTTPGQIWFTLKKDGVLIEEGVGQAPANSNLNEKQKSVYIKTKTMLGESEVLLFTVYVDNIFSGAKTDLVQFKYAWLIDENSAKEIKSGDRCGVFQVRTASAAGIMMDNEDTVSLSRDSVVTLIGNMKFIVADNDTLRFYPYVEQTAPGTYETRGTVAQENAVNSPIWDTYNFAGFFYDIKYDRTTEKLSLLHPVHFYKTNSNTIQKKELIYTTHSIPVDFKIFEKEGMNVDGSQSFRVVGWQAEKWVAVKGVSNKIAKIALEMDKEEKKTMTTGETWPLGAGYELTIDSIDARTTPRQVGFTLTKDRALIEKFMGQAPANSNPDEKQKAVYFKKKNILGEPEALLFTIYVDNIFSGAISDMVQFKYAWLIDESSAKEIKSADKFGVFVVRSADSTAIMMDNENIISLSRNSETNLMGNISFVIADNDTLRFYPKVENILNEK